MSKLRRLHLALQLEGYSTAKSHTGFMRVLARVVLNGQLDLKKSPLFGLCVNSSWQICPRGSYGAENPFVVSRQCLPSSWTKPCLV